MKQMDPIVPADITEIRSIGRAMHRSRAPAEKHEMSADPVPIEVRVALTRNLKVAESQVNLDDKCT